MLAHKRCASVNGKKKTRKEECNCWGQQSTGLGDNSKCMNVFLADTAYTKHACLRKSYWWQIHSNKLLPCFHNPRSRVLTSLTKSSRSPRGVSIDSTSSKLSSSSGRWPFRPRTPTVSIHRVRQSEINNGLPVYTNDFLLSESDLGPLESDFEVTSLDADFDCSPSFFPRTMM